VAGYKLPDNVDVTGGLDFKLPNGKHTGYISNVTFNDVNILVKGGNPASDTLANPNELGVGQYNVADLKIQPSYGIWARHVKGLEIINSSFNYEKRDSRYPLFFDDVKGAAVTSVKMVKPADNNTLIGFKNANGITIKNSLYYTDSWGNSPKIFH